MKNRLLAIAFIVLCTSGYLTAQVNRKVNLNFLNQVPLWLTENKVPAVGIGIIEGGKLKYVKVFGSLQKNVPAPVNTIFNIASMTKPVVAMLVLELVQSGQWNLDESLDKYWIDPDILNDTLHKHLTTRIVLTHQTGFPNWRNGKLKFEFAPGTQCQYSGEGFEYLARALESKFKKPLEELLDSVLFKPLGMKDTRYWSAVVDMSRYARWHDSQGKEYETSHESRTSAADFLLTTVKDYSKFMVYVMNGAGLSTGLFNDMVHSQVNVKKHVGKGLGWEVISDLPNGEYSLQHGGGDRGVKTMGFILPNSKRGVIVFTNGDNGATVIDSIFARSIDIGQEILDFTNGAYTAPTITLSNEILEQYVGTYLRSDATGYNLSITKAGYTLQITGEGVPLMNLSAEKEDLFFIKGLGYRYEFIRDESKKIVKMNIYDNDKLLLDAKKIK
jgi:CubicO group peptidase (beta-lactamase class C family)